MQSNEVLEALYQTIIDRREQPKEGSYTCYLFEKGLDKILKKGSGRNAARRSSPLKNGDNHETVLENFRSSLSPDGDDGQRRDPALRCPGGIGQAQREKPAI